MYFHRFQEFPSKLQNFSQMSDGYFCYFLTNISENLFKKKNQILYTNFVHIIQGKFAFFSPAWVKHYLDVVLFHRTPNENIPSMGPPVLANTTFVMRTRLPILEAPNPNKIATTPKPSAETVKNKYSLEMVPVFTEYGEKKSFK